MDLALVALGSLSGKFREVASSAAEGQIVRYAERISGQRHVRLRLHAAPIDPAQSLAQFVFDEEEERTVVCTSATLATDGNFEHFKSRCGVKDDPHELIVGSVFDYPTQALLYQACAARFRLEGERPVFRRSGRRDCAPAQCEPGPRALPLYQLERITEGCMSVCPMSPGLCRRRENTPATCCWTGFERRLIAFCWRQDHSGKGSICLATILSLVVLDKLPFPTPSVPLHDARMRALDEVAAGSSFRNYMLPLMTLALKQGFGPSDPANQRSRCCGDSG